MRTEEIVRDIEATTREQIRRHLRRYAEESADNCEAIVMIATDEPEFTEALYNVFVSLGFPKMDIEEFEDHLHVESHKNPKGAALRIIELLDASDDLTDVFRRALVGQAYESDGRWVVQA